MRKYLLVMVLALSVAVGSLLWNADQQRKSQLPSVPSSPSIAPENVPVELANYYAQEVEWTNCGSGFECARVNVPTNYADPQAAAMSIAVNRIKASGESLGALLVNPGGPGGSGLEYAQAVDFIVTPNLRENFDIVGFDPRGVGQSTPVKCLTDDQIDKFIAVDGTPDDASEIAGLQEINSQFAQGCASTSPDTFAFVDTRSAARDLDIIRAVLGEAKLNWLGKSYGTYLGATYASLFPENVGRMVLDGAIDPSLTNEQLSYGQALGFEDALTRFLTDCVENDFCNFNSVDEGKKFIQDLFAELDANPVPLEDGREFTESMAVFGVIANLYDVLYGWPALVEALNDAADGEFAGMVAALDMYTERDPNGKFTSNANEVIAAVNCIDRSDRPAIAVAGERAAQWAIEAPTFGAYLGWGIASCTDWQASAVGTPAPITAQGAAPILVVSTTHDPATPHAWGVALSEQLASGKLLTFDGDGHTAYKQGSECIDELVDQYYLTGEIEDGLTCQTEASGS